jgi:tetratricopeptide (TPR) repeat protein
MARIESPRHLCAPDQPIPFQTVMADLPSAEAMNARGILRLRCRDLVGALADFDAALLQRPGYAEALNNRGVLRFRHGDHSGARMDFDAAVRARKDYAEAYQNRGALRLFQHDFAGALSDLDAALTVTPRVVAALILRGNARWHLCDLDGFVQDYQEAFAIDRRRAAAEVLNRLRFDARDPAPTQADCTLHLRHNPGDGVAHARRGFLLLLHGQIAAAQPHFDLCRQATPALTEILDILLQIIQERRRSQPTRA